MTPPPPVTCPSCSGKKQSLCHINRGDKPHTWEMVDCYTCGGVGSLTPEHADRYAEGRRRTADRRARLMTLRDEAKRLGITPKELSDIEFGRTNQ
jgi:hypothetical protein